MGQEFRSGSTGKFYLGVAQEVDWSVSHLKNFLELEGHLQGSTLTHTAGKLVGAIGGRAQFPIRRASPEGCLNVLMSWKLASPRAFLSKDRGRSHGAFYDVASEATHHPFHLILWMTQAVLTQSGKGLHNVTNTRRKKSLAGAWEGWILEAGYHIPQSTPSIKGSKKGYLRLSRLFAGLGAKVKEAICDDLSLHRHHKRFWRAYLKTASNIRKLWEISTIHLSPRF